MGMLHAECKATATTAIAVRYSGQSHTPAKDFDTFKFDVMTPFLNAFENASRKVTKIPIWRYIIAAFNFNFVLS